MASGKKNSSGFTDVEMGPLMGQASTGSSNKFVNDRSAIKRTSTDDSLGAMKVVQRPISVPKPTKAPVSKTISALLLYSFCSVSMVLVNKSLSSR